MWVTTPSWCTQQSSEHILWDILYTLYPLNYPTLTAVGYKCPKPLMTTNMFMTVHGSLLNMKPAVTICILPRALIAAPMHSYDSHQSPFYPNREIPMNAWCPLIESSGSAAWPQSCIYCFYACFYDNFIERAHVHVYLDTLMFQLHIFNALSKYVISVIKEDESACHNLLTHGDAYKCVIELTHHWCR